MSIAPTIWATYNALRERRGRVDQVLSELERGVQANPALLVAPRLFPEWRALEAAFPDQPLDVSIAVVGAFRGGKSTIINALLGASLLPAAHVATTATITRIRYRPNGYRVCVQYTSEEDESFRLAKSDLTRIFGLEFEEAKTELQDRASRGGVEALLGMYGAIGKHGAVSWDRVQELHSDFQRNKILPPLPLPDLLGCQEEHLKEDLASIEKAVKPYVMFTGVDGAFDVNAAMRQFMISNVTVEGPFPVLQSREDSPGSLTLIDTPGLDDPRPFVKRIVHGFLRAADCVCLNVSHGGNISATDVEVLRLLLNETLHRKLIITLAKIDTLNATPEMIAHQVEYQRGELNTQIGEIHPDAAAAAERFLRETEIIPIAALAALLRARKNHGEPIDPRFDWMVQQYPTPEADGTGELFKQIRRTLDGSERLAAVIARAKESLDRVVTNAAAALQAGVADRALTGEQLEQRARELAAATDGVNRAFQVAIEAAVGNVREQWGRQRSENHRHFNNMLAPIALSQLIKVEAFIRDATNDHWRHWRRLKAVANGGGYDSDLSEDIAQSALDGVPLLLRHAAESVLTTAQELVGNASSIANEAIRTLVAGAEQLADIRIELQNVIAADLRAAQAEYSQFTRKATEELFGRTARQKMMSAATGIVARFSEKARPMRGQGVQARMHEALRDVMIDFVQQMPEYVKKEFAGEIDQLFVAAENGAIEVYNRVQRTAVQFVAERLEQLRAAAEQAHHTKAEAILAEKQMLAELLERLANANSERPGAA